MSQSRLYSDYFRHASLRERMKRTFFLIGMRQSLIVPFIVIILWLNIKSGKSKIQSQGGEKNQYRKLKIDPICFGR